MHFILWMTGVLASFCLLAVGARELSGGLTTFQILFFRSVVGLVFISAIILMSKNTSSIRTHNLKLHTFRNIFHFAGQYGWFLGLGLLPLAEVFALEFTVPFWTLIIAALFLGEKITPAKAIAVLLGMVGVLIIVQPGYAIIDPAAFIVLGAAFCYAVSHSSTKYLTMDNSPVCILFYMCVIQLPIALVFSLKGWQWPTYDEWLWLVVVGGLGLSAHFCMAKAMQYAEVTKAVTVDFLRLPLIALVGVFFYSEDFEISLLIGGAVMLIGNLINIRSRFTKPPLK